MKKIILFSISVSFFALLTIDNSQVFAQRIPTNTFWCTWDVFGGGCMYGSSDCKPGYTSDRTSCESIRDFLRCRDASFACVPARPTPTPTPPPPSPPTTRCSSTEISTAIGCIDVNNVNNFTAAILRLAIGIGGGIAFLLMLFATFQIMTSAGDPERLKAGKELLTSAIAGLLLIIFSVFLLQLIGVQILQIPGFSR